MPLIHDAHYLQFKFLLQTTQTNHSSNIFCFSYFFGTVMKKRKKNILKKLILDYFISSGVGWVLYIFIQLWCFVLKSKVALEKNPFLLVFSFYYCNNMTSSVADSHRPTEWILITQMMKFTHFFALPNYCSCLWSRSRWPNYINYFFIFIGYFYDIVIVYG